MPPLYGPGGGFQRQGTVQHRLRRGGEVAYHGCANSLPALIALLIDTAIDFSASRIAINASDEIGTETELRIRLGTGVILL